MIHSRHKYFLASSAIPCLALTVLTIQATPCSNGQQCPDCDSSGDCLAPCKSGYFGLKCMSVCSSGCKHGLCALTLRGIEYCTEGCVPGFRGTSCTIPCHNPGTQCTVCEGDCDGGYCSLSPTSCVSGCVDSYYGLDCKDCSERCRSCNRSTGMCDECHVPYRGLTCEMSCENCAGTCVSGCEEGCKPGFYGNWCDKMCSENCRPGPNKTAVSDFESDQNTSMNCIPECDNNTGDCIHGCNDGWYGKHCSSRCSRKCAGISCTDSGSCAAGCAPGYAGTDCSCFENCIHHVCHPNNGPCVKGCINSYYGAFCNISCEVCLDGVCDRTHGNCTRGCNDTEQTCTSSCTKDCPLEVCLKARPCSKPTSENHTPIAITTGTVAACLFCFIAIIVAMRIAFYKRFNRDEADDVQVECPENQPEAHNYELVDVEPDNNESGPVIVFL